MKRTLESSSLALFALLVLSCDGWSVVNVKRRIFLDSIVTSSLATALPTQAIGEYATISKKPGTIETLIPILQLQHTTTKLLHLIENDPFSPSVVVLLKSIPSEEKLFKNIFDGYSDPVSYKQRFVDQNAFLVYYTKGFDGPGRPSIESDLPVKQTLQFGARNDAWVAYNDFLVEFNYQQQNTAETNQAEDLIVPLKEMIKALDRYLSQASSEQLASALQSIEKSP